MNALAIIPAYLTDPRDLEALCDCIESLARTQPKGCDVLVVDDCSPRDDLLKAVASMKPELEFEVHRKRENTGFANTVNVGLQRCLDEGRDAVLVNADIEFITDGWLQVMQNQRTLSGDGLASIVGALLLYPSGLIQHGGVYFSLLHRCFEHIYKYAPFNLPEAQQPRVCPVTGALQFIRHDCLADIGIYDNHFRLGWEDVDYCIRAWLAGRQTVYQPDIRAYHYESMFRGRGSDKMRSWEAYSWTYFCHKYQDQSFMEFVPSVV